MSQKREQKKKKRAERERQYARRKAAEAVQIPAGYSTPVMRHFAFDSPFNGLTEAQQRELFHEAGVRAAQAFETGVDTLNAFILKHDPVQLLAAVAFYTQFQGVGPHTDFTEPPPFPQALAETLQALCLRHRPDRFANEPVLHPGLGAILDQLKTCAEAFAGKRYRALAEVTERDKQLLVAIEGARLHTQLLRNWGYPQHMRAIAGELFEPLDGPIERQTGFSATQLLALTRGIHDTVGERATAFARRFGAAFRQKSRRAVVREFCRLANVGEGEADIQRLMASRAATNRQVKLLLLSYFHHDLPAVFSFTVEDCLALIPGGGDEERLKALLDALSLPFGALSETPCEHLFMQSEVRTKPLIRTGEGMYFVPVAGLLHSYTVEMLESLIFRDAALKRAYHERRAVYLEASVAQLVRAAFPGCPVHTGTKAIDPTDGAEYENDCLVVVGPVAVVLEAKSERVEDAARRGAQNTLKNHYKSLVREPATQATRFARLLEGGQGVRRFATAGGGTYELDLSSIRRAVCVAVTLDWFPATGMCWRRLLAAGLVTGEQRPTLNVSLADLQVMVEVLARPATLLHYLLRRADWEQYVDYLGDEEDVLVYYLSEGLAIPEPLRDGSAAITLYGRSDELHRYYMAEWSGEGGAVPRPRRLLGAWWDAILRRVEARPLAQKWDIACALLDLSYAQQEAFAGRFQELISSVRRGGRENGLVFHGAGSAPRSAVVGFAYRALSRADRDAQADDLAAQACTKFGATRVVVIGRDVDLRDEPYSFFALVDRPPECPGTRDGAAVDSTP